MRTRWNRLRSRGRWRAEESTSACFAALALFDFEIFLSFPLGRGKWSEGLTGSQSKTLWLLLPECGSWSAAKFAGSAQHWGVIEAAGSDD